MSFCSPGLWITGQREREREHKMGLGIKEGVRRMESREEVQLEEEDHRKGGRVIGEGDGGGESDVWRDRKRGWL